jgi:hypothetical protein
LQNIEELQDMIGRSDDVMAFDDCASAEPLLDQIIEDCAWDPDSHRKRAKCRKERGDIQNAIADVRAIAKLVPDSTEVYLETANM